MGMVILFTAIYLPTQYGGFGNCGAMSPPHEEKWGKTKQTPLPPPPPCSKTTTATTTTTTTTNK